MRKARGDIWHWHDADWWIVIPTNIGWKRNGENVMGRGLAREAARRFDGLALWYGLHCRDHGASAGVVTWPLHHLIMFPVKPLREDAPWLSWQQKADLGLIQRSAWELSQLKLRGFLQGAPIAVPAVGCGNGRLKLEQVEPILAAYLDNDFTLVTFAA